MKKFIIILSFFSCLFAGAQTIERYYDWEWKPCEPGLSRFYSEIKNTDTGWYRTDYYTANYHLQMKGLYIDSACKIKNGLFVYFNSNGKIYSIGHYVKNKLDGVWLHFHYNGMMSDSSVFDMGNRVGTELGWYQNGYMSDSTVFKSDGTAVEVSWYDNGVPSSAGRLLNGKNIGRWLYYHKNGKPAAAEDYDNGKLLNKIYYDEEGNQLDDTTNRDKPAEFAGGSNAWTKFLEKNLIFPTGYSLVNTDIITVVVDATIDEDGNVRDAYMEIPFKTPFDNEALRVIKKSPKWLPAIHHNRRVATLVRQPISFHETSD